MDFIDSIVARAQQSPGTVILPEAEDERTLRAAATIEEKGFAKVLLVGDLGQVTAKCREARITREFEIVDPSKAEWLEEFADEFYKMRKAKGMTPDKARDLMREPIHHGIMMLHHGKADGLVAGANHSTSDTLRPALQILRTASGVSLVSSFFFMARGEEVYLFADCGLVEDPDAEQLADIALTTAETAITFGIPPTLAMLSYSTKGSARSPLTEKVVKATRIARERAGERFSPDRGVEIDGELQVDAALIERVGDTKAPGSPVAGRARVLIFPDLNAGNIGYKLVHYLGGFDAYGPIIQGMRLPVNDLSRACEAGDIVGVAAVTVVQSLLAKGLEG